MTTSLAELDGFSSMKLSIIIVSYNTRSLTLQTLESIADTLKKSTDLRDETEVIVVDNNSLDDSADAVQQFSHTVSFPVILIKNPDNQGFAKANNIGIKRARGRYYLLLNSDTVVKDKALEELVAVMDSAEPDDTSAPTYNSTPTDKIGIAAASLYFPSNRYQPQGGNFPTLATLFFHMSLLDDLPLIGKYLPSTQHTGKRVVVPNKQQNVITKDWVGGTAMLIKKDVVSEIGLLDEAIFMYGEDVEFCMRAKQHHWDVVEVPQAKVIHYQSASSTPKNAITGELKGYHYIWAKHKPYWQAPFLKAILLMGVLLRACIFGTIKKDPEKKTLYWSLVRDIKSW